MKIVHIEDFFHPNAGYQINVLPKYLNKLGYKNTIITTSLEKSPDNLREFFGAEQIKMKDSRYTTETGVNIIRLPIYKFISGRAIWKFRTLFRTIKAEKPDIIYVHGNDTLASIVLLLINRVFKTNFIFDSHMLEMASRNKYKKVFRFLYAHFITPILIKNKYFVIKVQDTNFLQENYKIPFYLTPYISFGSDVDLFDPSNYDKHKIKKDLGISNEKVYIYSGKLDEEKGGLLLARAFKKKISDQPIVLLIVGNTPNNEYGRKVEYLLEESENEILHLSTKSYTELAQYYNVADYAVFPKQCSLSFFDFQCMGIPVIFEENEINLERRKNINFTFQANNVDDFREKLKTSLHISDSEYNKRSKSAQHWIRAEYNYYKQAQKYKHYIDITIGEKDV